MKDLTSKAGLSEQFEIASAATSAWEIGNPVYPPARQKLAEHGIDCNGKTARQMTLLDYARYDHLIGMDESNLCDILRLVGGDPQHKVSLLMAHTDHPVKWQTHGSQETASRSFRSWEKTKWRAACWMRLRRGGDHVEVF